MQNVVLVSQFERFLYLLSLICSTIRLQHYEDLYAKLDSREGIKMVCKLAKTWYMEPYCFQG